MQKNNKVRPGEGNNGKDSPKTVARQTLIDASVMIWPVNIRPL
jgi:hypothetical protein